MKGIDFRRILFIGLSMLFTLNFVYSQNIAITDDDAYSPDGSAMLDIKSTSKGLLIPRLDSLQRVSISSPATGLLVFDTDDNAFFYFDGSDWLNLSSNVVNPAVTDLNTALFSVVNNAGDTVFAVYPEGVVINVGDGDAKGNRGGFAVGGLSGGGKVPAPNYLTVSPDSVRVYVDTSSAKANRGGFAVGGLSSNGKTISRNYLTVSDDSVRIYIEEDEEKGNRGGFAVGGLSSNEKAVDFSEFLSVRPKGTKIKTKEGGTGFEIEEIGSSNKNYLDITPDNTLIGQDAGQANTIGIRNTFIGYQSGNANTEGYDNIFLGNQSGFSNESGTSNIFLGSGSGKKNTTGYANIFVGTSSGEQNITGQQNIHIGEQAGFSMQSGSKNISIGTVAGYTNVEGNSNVYLGNFAGYRNLGSSNVMIGRTAGMENILGEGNVFIGEQSGRQASDGSGNVFIGREAGYGELNSNKLYIANTRTNAPLVYGEFDNNLLQVNGTLKVSDVLNLNPKSNFPGNPNEGDIIYDSISHSIKYYNGSIWLELAADTATTYPPKIATYGISTADILASSFEAWIHYSDSGSSALVEAGLCYSYNPFFDINDPYVTKVDSAIPSYGSYKIKVSGITWSSYYYIRAYAFNSHGSALGEMKRIETPASNALPSISTNEVLNITQTSASVLSDLTLPGATALIERGICWSTSTEPTLADNYIDTTAIFHLDTAEITGLIAETTYYVRAYATNSIGTAYGNEVVFTTAGAESIVTDIEGNEYNIVQIGTQTWMKENLKTLRYRDSSSIPNVTDNTEWEELTTGAFSWYNNDSVSYHDTYGVIYNHYAVADSRKLCPNGWHVPSFDEWTTLSYYLGGDHQAGSKLKESGTTHWAPPNMGYPIGDTAKNETGFTALPGGWRDGVFQYLTGGSSWLMSTEISVQDSWFIDMYYYTGAVNRYTYSKYYGGYVRCIKDQ
jgi:uncharacterized protein (TIGR02145 family)